MRKFNFIQLLMPENVWRWDHFTDEYDETILGDGQWLMIKDKLIFTAQDFVRQVFSFDKIALSPPKKREVVAGEFIGKYGRLEQNGIYCRYSFEVVFGDTVHSFTVENIPVSSDTEKIEVFFGSLFNYLSSAYISLESHLSRSESGYLLASQGLMRLGDSFILNFPKTVILEYLYYLLNYEKVELSDNAYTYRDLNRYNLQLLENAYNHGIELASRKIENKEIYTGFIFNLSEAELISNSVKLIKLAQPIEFGSFKQLKSIMTATNGRNIFFNVSGNLITHLFITRENVPEIAMEPFGGGKTFVGKPLIMSIQGNSHVTFLQGDSTRNRSLLQIINNRPLIKDYNFIETYLRRILDSNLSSGNSTATFIKWLLKISIRKKGTTVIIGDFKKESLAKKLVSFADVSIAQPMIYADDPHVRMLLDHISTPDGALIFDKGGNLLFMSAILPFSKGSKMIGGGARHQSTINFTRSNKCIGITISEDGTTSIFNNGKLEIKF